MLWVGASIMIKKTNLLTIKVNLKVQNGKLFSVKKYILGLDFIFLAFLTFSTLNGVSVSARNTRF